MWSSLDYCVTLILPEPFLSKVLCLSLTTDSLAGLFSAHGSNLTMSQLQVVYISTKDRQVCVCWCVSDHAVIVSDGFRALNMKKTKLFQRNLTRPLFLCHKGIKQCTFKCSILTTLARWTFLCNCFYIHLAYINVIGAVDLQMALSMFNHSTPSFFEHSVKNRATFQRPATHARNIVYAYD